MQEMTVDRAVDNAIASVEMEGFTITGDERDLIYELVRKEIMLADARHHLRQGDAAVADCRKEIVQRIAVRLPQILADDRFELIGRKRDSHASALVLQ